MNKLIIDLKKQKGKAQRIVFESYARMLFNVCYRYLNDKELAEEVLSQSFVSIFSKVSNTDIENRATLYAWMRRITINQSLMELRKQVRFPKTIELFEEVEQSPLESDQGILVEELFELVENLPIGYRTIFSLYVVEGYRHEEIAEKLGITIGTSKSQLSKARRMLQSQIIKMELQDEKVN